MKKEIIIFTSKAGNGHQTASQALSGILSPLYDVQVINPFEKILKNLDFLWKRIDGENIYNMLLRNNFIGTTNFLCQSLKVQILTWYKKKIEKALARFLEDKNPDLVISVIPIINFAINNATQKQAIPFLLVTTDGDLTNWTYNIKEIKRFDFCATIGFETQKTRKKLICSGMADSQIIHTGFPIKRDFFEQKNHEKIRKEWLVPDNTFTIMIFMGGAGSLETYRYVQKIIAMGMKVHLLVCVGKNKKMAYALEKIKRELLNKSISLSIIPFTHKISDLMSISDLLITKPGPGSINEALHMQLPLILDQMGSVLFWEKENIRFVQEHNFGDVLTSWQALEGLVKKYYSDREYYAQKKEHLNKFQAPDFVGNVNKIVTKLCPLMAKKSQLDRTTLS